MKLTFDASELQRKLVEPLQGGAERVRFAAVLALTRTGQAVRDAERRELADVFDRPTPYTLGAIYLQPATMARPEARVGVKDEQAGPRSALAWLQWHIKGGARSLKAFEALLVRAGAMSSSQRAVPGAYARLDAYGNVSRGQLVQVLSQLRIDTTAGSTRSLPRLNATDRGALAEVAKYGRSAPGNYDNTDRANARAKAGTIRRAYARAGGQFVAFPRGRGKLKPGIYQVRQFAAGRADPRPVLLFVNRTSYEAGRFDFDYVAQLAVQRELPRNLSGQLARSLLQANAAPGVRVNLA